MTPMERDYPTICAWTRHRTVSTEALRDELEKALAWIDSGAASPGDFAMSMAELVSLRQNALLTAGLRREAAASVALDKGDGQTFTLDEGVRYDRPVAGDGHLYVAYRSNPGVCISCGGPEHAP
jgi:hypothetical protein